MTRLAQALVRSVSTLATISLVLFNDLGDASAHGRRSCLPSNTLSIPPRHTMANDVTKAEFQAMLAKIKKTHDHFFKETNTRLRIKADWDDGAVNAFADRDFDVYIIEVFGGLARYPALTRDGFTLIVCHELGHHLGGAPTGMDLGWPSIEGQADYFATLKCLRRVFADEDNEAALRGKAVDPTVRAGCERSTSDPKERLICQRSALAGLSAATMLHELDGRGATPSFATPDTRVVPRTETDHPEAQCRLDTYVSGTICLADLSKNPGPTDPKQNVCFEGRDLEGFRPRCWYRP